MSTKTAVVVGFVGKLPYAGMSLYNLHHLVGLQDLGYKVHYVETIDYPDQCYDPASNSMTSDAGGAVKYLSELLPDYGIPAESFSFIDLEGQCHGSGWDALRTSLDTADFLMTLDTPSWNDEFERCPRRAFVDTDPMFNQLEMLAGGIRARVVPHYDTVFTYGMRIGQPDCAIPDAGRRWIPTHTLISTRLWPVCPPTEGAPVTGVMQWTGRTLTFEGREYGHKNMEFERFIDLPSKTNQTFSIAIGGSRVPRQMLESKGWDLLSPLRVTGTIPAYRQFIAGSYADLGIAKHAYVASRSGWFSDRSTCYMASGRPVLHQDTGFAEWMPAESGVLRFSEPAGVLECLARLHKDYEQHARAAREVAIEYFEATRVLTKMLTDAGFR
jgi:hypothetical protein